ncbi:MAG: glutamate racemase [Gammaproteobacteria bacterium]|nr:glutamate racemase [Gammaproteobacteria bacterium]
MPRPDQRPVGVFDSGVGGLTVLKAMREAMPHEDLLYLGDTARLPYGTKSAASVLRYAHRAAEHLIGYDIKMLVIACNTASAVALDDLQRDLAPLPVVGVVKPGARAAVAARPAARHLVLATEATVRLGAYSRALAEIDEHAEVSEMACEMLVAQAEEGWTEGAVAEAIVRAYLDPVLGSAAKPDSLILGCTHFPILRGVIRSVVGADMSIVDSAVTTASLVQERLRSGGIGGAAGRTGSLRLLATDGGRRFAQVGGTFLGEPLSTEAVEIVDI